eukprot:12134965-Alexandrium_andersonii.AAC.1
MGLRCGRGKHIKCDSTTISLSRATCNHATHGSWFAQHDAQQTTNTACVWAATCQGFTCDGHGDQTT